MKNKISAASQKGVTNRNFDMFIYVDRLSVYEQVCFIHVWFLLQKIKIKHSCIVNIFPLVFCNAKVSRARVRGTAPLALKNILLSLFFPSPFVLSDPQ